MQLCGDELDKYGEREEGGKFLPGQPRLGYYPWVAEGYRVFFAVMTNYHLRGLKKHIFIISQWC